MFFSKTAAASALLLASGSLAAAQTCSTDGMYCTAAGSSPNYTWCASGAVYNFACSAGTVCIQSGSSVYCGFSTGPASSTTTTTTTTTTAKSSTTTTTTTAKSSTTTTTTTKPTTTTTTTTTTTKPTTTTTTTTTKPTTTTTTTTTTKTTSTPSSTPVSGNYTPVNVRSRLGKLNIAYWGANGQYGEKSLQATCAENNYDVIVVAFLDTFGHGQVPQVHLDHPFNETTVGIQYCQSTGTAVILSAGGANAGGSSLSSSSDASNFATQLWNTFLGGNINDPTRPFGTAVFDGFDLDIENGANGYYPDFVNTYRSLAPKGSYYLTAAPQCFYPDASLGSTLSSVGGQFDWVSVQFYNNWCSADNYQAGDISNINARFNYDQWDQLAAQEGFDLALGLAASTVAASSGYVAPAGVANIVKEIRATSGASSRFAGVMFWSTAHADNNNNFGGAIKTILQS